MSTPTMIGAVSIIEHHVANNLQGARLIGLIFVRREAEREGYWEDRYVIAWQNDRESGTHNANVDLEGRVLTTSGHYIRAREAHDKRYEAQEAINDMVLRAGLA